jgi:membrane protein required for colicin V production
MFWYDILIIAIIAAGFLYGFIKGIISEIFAIAGLIIGFLVAMKYSFLIQPFLLRFIKGETGAFVIGFILLFLLTAAGIIMLGIFFKKAIKFIRLSWLDRWIGGLVGLVKGIIVVGLISLIIVALFPDGKAFMKQSTFGRYTIAIVRIAAYLLPERFRKGIGSGSRGSHVEKMIDFCDTLGYTSSEVFRKEYTWRM